ncbi:MAG: hypothetical protein HYX60_02680 [Legionella longbeachae]|nr:hypothetical protein [Legionella longbeachae]
MYQLYEATFFIKPTIRNTLRVYPWIHTNFSEAGYAYFVSLGIDPAHAIHLASTKVNAYYFQLEAQQASQAFTDPGENQNVQLSYLRSLIKELTRKGGWEDDLQHCIHNIAIAINSEKPWGDNLPETEEIGIGERLVYTKAIQYAKDLKRIDEEKMSSQIFVKHINFRSGLLDSVDPLDPPQTDICIIL